MAELISNLRSKLSKHLVNASGKSLRRKFVLFQSDDWGMERMINPDTYNRLINKGIPLNLNPYTCLDSFERDQDLIRLAEVLSKYRDGFGNPVKFTLNNVMTNPDFEKIRQSNFCEYFFQPFIKTKDRYPDSSKIFNIYKEGISSGVFEMAFHGREHLHVNHWLDKLVNKELNYMTLFDEGVYSASFLSGSNCMTDNLDSMAIYNQKDEETIEHMIREGVSIFQKIWGFMPNSFIAPCYSWNDHVENVFHELGVDVIQSGIGQNYPIQGTLKRKIIRRFTGEQNQYKQKYAVRNVSFEPSLSKEKDWVSSALWEVSNAFDWNVPAILESHRLNYMGRMSEANANRGFILLDQLLKEILKRWPDVSFIFSSEINNLYSK